MKLSKQQLVDGVATYITDEVIKNVPETSMKVILGTAVYSMRSNPSLLEQYVFGNPIFCAMCKYEDGYDLDGLIEGLKRSIVEYGSFAITIPSIPLISKDAKVLSFSSTDIDTLKTYLERSVNV